MIKKAQQALEFAVSLGEQKIPAFPCMENKRPACPGGYKAATTDLQCLNDLWRKYPGVLIGVPTGELSGYDVLDIDPRHSGDVWLEKSLIKIPPTRMHDTRSGGTHLLFRHHPHLRNSAGKIAPGVDVRADGGYVIWWPAVGLPVYNDQIVVEWPYWLLSELIPAPRLRNPALVDKKFCDTYAESALRNAAKNIAMAPIGCRNDTLNKEIFSIARFIGVGELNAEFVLEVLAEAAFSAGLSKSEIIATIQSALNARGLS